MVEKSQNTPTADSRWRNLNTGELATVRRVLPRSPGGALLYPLVEYVPDGYVRPWFAEHEPWFALADWHQHWEPANPVGADGERSVS